MMETKYKLLLDYPRLDKDIKVGDEVEKLMSGGYIHPSGAVVGTKEVENYTYEITSYIDYAGKVYRSQGNGLFKCLTTGYVFDEDELSTDGISRIHSVKRIVVGSGHGVEFSIGDEVYHRSPVHLQRPDVGDKHQIEEMGYRFLIGEFVIGGDDLLLVYPMKNNMFAYHNYFKYCDIHDIDRALFKYSGTQDGISMVNDPIEKVWVVDPNSNWEIFKRYIRDDKFRINPDSYYFSNKTAAYEFQDEHMPRYSKHDIRENMEWFLE